MKIITELIINKWYKINSEKYVKRNNMYTDLKWRLHISGVQRQ